jgi:hypothetical protein
MPPLFSEKLDTREFIETKWMMVQFQRGDKFSLYKMNQKIYQFIQDAKEQ